jgi:hypothetical protein
MTTSVNEQKDALLNAIVDNPELALMAAKWFARNVTFPELHKFFQDLPAAYDMVFPFQTKIGEVWETDGDDKYIITRIDPFTLVLTQLSTGKTYSKVVVNNVNKIKLPEFQQLIMGTHTRKIELWQRSTLCG